jgi:hypothetical protein
MHVTGGISADTFSIPGIERNQVNPKLGVTWETRPGLVMRMTAVRTLKRTVVSSQTLEPTQVAGFNQFFGDSNGADAWRYAWALDHAITKKISGGLELSLRKLNIPIRAASTGAVSYRSSEDHLARLYLYTAPLPWLAMISDYRFDRLLRDAAGNNEDLLAHSQAHRAGAEMRAFSTNGLFSRFRTTFIMQNGRFQNARQLVVPGADRFWVVDATLGYRLPRQLGLIALEIRNALDEQFSFQDSSPEDSKLLPARFLALRSSLLF